MAMNIPKVEGPSVQLQGIPDAYEQAPRALGQAGMVRAQQTVDAANLAGKYAEAIQRERDEMDQVRVDDALNKLRARQIDLTFDKDEGFTTQRGDAVMKRQSGKPLSDEYAERLNEERRKLADDLGNERQKRKFGMMANDVVTSFNGQVRKYEGEQVEVYKKSVATGTISLRNDEIARFYNDPARVDRALEDINAAVATLGKGMDSKAIQAEQLRQGSNAVRGAINSALAANQPVEAATLMKQFADRMTEDDRTAASKAMKEMDTRMRAQAQGDSVFERGLGMEEALAETRRKFKDDPFARDAAVAEIKTRFAEREAMDVQGAKQVSKSAWSILMAKGSMSAIPPDMMDTLRKKAPEEERQMRDWLEAKWRRAKADAESRPQTEDEVRAYIGLIDFANERPFEFAELDLARYQPYVTKPHFERLIAMRAGIGKNEAKQTSLLQAQKRTEAIVMAELRAAGIDTTPKEGSAQSRALMNYRMALNDALVTRMQGAPAPLDDKALREIGLGLLRPGTEQGSGIFGLLQTTKRDYEIKAERATGVQKTYVTPFDSIPEAARTEIVNDLRAKQAGMGPRGALNTDQKGAVEREYQRRLEEGRYK